MKTKFLLLISIVICNYTFSQVPQTIKYQAIIRDNDGVVMADDSIHMKISVLPTINADSPVYTEVHYLKTNPSGLINLSIGAGISTLGDFSLINWGNSIHAVKIELNDLLGNGYKIIGKSEFSNVPYALFASNVSYSDTSSINEIQRLELINDTLFLSSSNYVVLDKITKQNTDKIFTTEAKTWYVSTSGSDNNDGLSENSAFRTLQYAYDQLPLIINHQQTIKLLDETHSENYRLDSSLHLPRKAMLYAHGKLLGFRTERSGKLSGAIVIKGPAIIAPNQKLKYGIYNGLGQLAIENVTIQGSNKNALLVSHRGDSYVHCNNVTIDGMNTTNIGIYCESSGQLEFTGEGEIKNCTTGVALFSLSDGISLSAETKIHNCLTGINSKGWVSYIQTAESDNALCRLYDCNVGIYASNGSHISLASSASDKRISIESPIKMLNGSSLSATYANINTTIECEQASVFLNNSDWQDQISLKASSIKLRKTKSYITKGKNNSLTPLKLDNNSTIIDNGNNTIINSNDEAIVLGDELIDKTINDNFDREIVVPLGVKTMLLKSGHSHDQVGCSLSKIGAYEGKKVNIIGHSWGVEFIGTDDFDIPSSFIIGTGSGQYTGAEFIFGNGKWRLLSLGLKR